MEPKAKPIPKLGERNIYCPFYSDCLDHAVNHFWRHWSCSECPYKLVHSIAGYECGVNDTDQYYDLSPGLARGIGKNLFD